MLNCFDFQEVDNCDSLKINVKFSNFIFQKLTIFIDLLKTDH
jgi:hypothetical protein